MAHAGRVKNKIFTLGTADGNFCMEKGGNKEFYPAWQIVRDQSRP